jgi:TPR repeat protein
MNLAFALRRMSALKGYENAQYNLGVMYEKGQGVQKDEKKAMAWFEKAAEQGNKDALNKLWVREGERVRG